MLEIGNHLVKTYSVHSNQTAAALKSGSLDVLATPVLIAFMEECCFECVEPFLSESETTVGTALNVTHESPTPVGNAVKVQCFLRAIEGKHLFFSVEASDKDGIISRGTHERHIVNALRFQQKCDRKKA